jgi:cytochrome c oxidase subunit 4
MTEHVATEHVAAEHAGETHDGHHNDPESIAREKRKYLIVFAMLGLLTALTVAAAEFLHLPPWETVAVAMAIALVKGTLVAAFFMHLLSERKLIFGVLTLTVAFFFFLLFAPLHHRENAKETYPNYDHTNGAASAHPAAAEHH